MGPTFVQGYILVPSILPRKGTQKCDRQTCRLGPNTAILYFTGVFLKYPLDHYITKSSSVWEITCRDLQDNSFCSKEQHSKNYMLTGRVEGFNHSWILSAFLVIVTHMLLI